MAETPEDAAASGTKRKMGRPKKEMAPPASKKQRISSWPLNSPQAPTPTLLSPGSLSTPRSTGLPSKVTSAAALPVLLQPQALDLQDSDYQSLAASGVLAASLARSRHAWTNEGLFERFWTVPPKAKAQDPMYRAMKSRGKCRLRIEPHIFEVEIYVVERDQPRPAAPKPAVAHKGPIPMWYGGRVEESGVSREKNDREHGPIYQRYMPPAAKPRAAPALNPRTLPPIAQPLPPPAAKKSSPDPVISMLANRASSDAELKALMKEVATGKASPEQLKIFQKHIDELTMLINNPKIDAGEAGASSASDSKIAQYDGPCDEPIRPHARTVPAYQTPPPPLRTYTPPATQPSHAKEVVFAFTTPGATEDRFLFPRHSILEPLSQQHLLASFIITRKGRLAQDPVLLAQPEADFWQPVTLMVEVAYGREGILRDVTKWVRPPDEVREEMKRVMATCTRAPEAHLALRLPVAAKGGSAPESERASKASTPVVVEEKRKKVKYFPAAPKKSALSKSATVVKKENASATGAVAPGSAMGCASAASTPLDSAGSAANAAEDGDADTGRPRRITRKSVRIAEG